MNNSFDIYLKNNKTNFNLKYFSNNDKKYFTLYIFY